MNKLNKVVTKIVVLNKMGADVQVNKVYPGSSGMKIGRMKTKLYEPDSDDDIDFGETDYKNLNEKEKYEWLLIDAMNEAKEEKPFQFQSTVNISKKKKGGLNDAYFK